MSSPLVDGLIRTKLLRVLYPLTSPGPPPCPNNSLDVVGTLQKAAALFDEQHMADASQISLGSVITVHSMKKWHVPRVYDSDTGSPHLDGRLLANGARSTNQTSISSPTLPSRSRALLEKLQLSFNSWRQD